MRDNHDKLPEILNATEQDGHYFAFVQIEQDGRQRYFRFGTSAEGCLALKRILQLRPFDQMPGVPYRHFFVPSVRRLEGDQVMMSIRVEAGKDGKEFEVEAPREVFANLKWFFDLDDWTKAKHLVVESSNALYQNSHDHKSIFGKVIKMAETALSKFKRQS